ncbi:MAG: hypothetical protein HY048_13685 [Acidobacteria bacterium]|nr:hypothetical protein [Acidobacteriota bacterium]
MDDRLARAESAIRELEGSQRALEQRIAVLERERSIRASSAVEPAVIDDDSRSPIARDEFVTLLSFIGRTFVALGGAYLLRALTDSAILPQAAGIALGLAYALSWLVFADRAGRHPLNAAFHGVVFAIIAFPLLWEATVRFKFLGPDATAAALTLVTAVALAVAIHRRLQAIAWIVVGAALPIALALITSTAVVVPFAVFLTLLGVATLWLGYALGWVWLRWPVALVADVAVYALTLRVSNGAWAESPLRVLGVQMLLLNGYLASIVVRTLFRGRDVIGFEIVQTIGVLGAGFGGAVYVAQSTGSGVATLALINLAFGAGCYAVAFVFIARRQGLRRNFHFYTALGLILILVSSRLLLGDAALAAACAALALVSTWGARQVDRVSLAIHGAIYLVAAGAISGLLTSAGYALAGSVADAWPPVTAAAAIVLATSAVCWLLPSPGDRAYARLPRLIVAIACVWAAGGTLVALLTPEVSGVPGAGADAGVVATVRTTVLAGAAVFLAWTGRYERFHESTWLLYPVLVIGGLKLLAEDLPRSRPATLFIALALYGGALIAAPRLIHRRA